MDTNEGKIGLIADAANRASNYLNCSSSAPVFPKQEVIDALAGFADSLPDDPTDASDVLAQLDELGSPANRSHH